MTEDPRGPLYSVVCTDTNPYGNWQTEFLEHTWVRSEMTGELVRLVATPNREPLPRHHTARVFRTSAPNTHPDFEGPYFPINRLFSLQEWLERERPVGTVLILDCDFAFRSPIDLHAEPGRPIGQRWEDAPNLDAFFDGWGAKTRTPDPDFTVGVQRITWPLLIHTSDLRRIIQRWIDLTIAIRAKDRLWESDMVALPIVLAEYGLVCDFETLGAWMPWPNELVADAPIVHYCQPVLNHAGEVLWYKQKYQPWALLDFDPDDAALPYCRDLMRMFKRFAAMKHAASKLTSHT